MRRISDRDRAGIIDYNLREDGTAVTIFADSQGDRVSRARAYIATILRKMPEGQRATIVEPGCSAGDISGWFSLGNDVYGIDVVPAAVELARERYPLMHVEQAVAEDLRPSACDILVLTEFLEHIDDPLWFVGEWLPHAKYVVIGHPVVRDGDDPEEGHVWAYYPEDFWLWFAAGRHTLRDYQLFSMGAYPMVMGWGERWA